MHVTQWLRSQPLLVPLCSPSQRGGNTARAVFLCHFHLRRPPAPDFFIISIIECYMFNIDCAGAGVNVRSTLFTFQINITSSDLRNQSAPRRQIKKSFSSPLVIDVKGKGQCGSFTYVFLFFLFFAEKPAAHAAVTPACSPMMKGDKVSEDNYSNTHRPHIYMW